MGGAMILYAINYSVCVCIVCMHGMSIVNICVCLYVCNIRTYIVMDYLQQDKVSPGAMHYYIIHTEWGSSAPLNFTAMRIGQV